MLQLVAINLVALAIFGDRLMTVQAIGIAFGIASLMPPPGIQGTPG